MDDEHASVCDRSAIDAADYRSLTEQFDRLWESASSAHQQNEMRRLLALINRYEAGQHGGRAACNDQGDHHGMRQTAMQ